MNKIGQVPVSLSREMPGFVLNRMQYALLNECFRLVLDDVGEFLIYCDFFSNQNTFLPSGNALARCSGCTNPQIFGTSPFAPADFETPELSFIDQTAPPDPNS